MKNISKPAAFTKLRGFTLVELMIAATLTGLVLTAILTITITCLKIYNNNANKLTVDKDMRKYTMYFENDAAYSNTFYIYDTVANGAPALDTTTSTDNYINPGQAGDLLLLITTATNPDGSTDVKRVIAYYHVVTDATTNSGPVYRLDTQGDNASAANPSPDFGAPGTTPVYQLYTTYTKKGFYQGQTLQTVMKNLTTTNNAFMPSVVGNAAYDGTNTPTRLFYYLVKATTSKGAFMVQSQIRETQQNGDPYCIDTYNLTMWPRS
ncbi:MAG TPA: prepilin-type N-terminal cleavage/methylation domain-containing protein [Opitutaceae bacterium]|jgi:prepilin-type N-terminal cleavage/methylation domain-containing protein|nr:prepilin-type N-terminal cleavage/methylation domain-containing protein [Opitutaceae bacterium]